MLCIFVFVWFDYVPSTIFQLYRDGSSWFEPEMCLAQGPQRSDAGDARTRGPSVSSQAHHHWATALPNMLCTATHTCKCNNIAFHQKAIDIRYITIACVFYKIVPENILAPSN